jgi:hypothetical protein
MRTLRASEISAYLYCQRAWWYQKQGKPSENQVELTSGTDLHYRHGRSVLVTGCLRALAYGLLLLALALLTIYITGRFL